MFASLAYPFPSACPFGPAPPPPCASGPAAACLRAQRPPEWPTSSACPVGLLARHGILPHPRALADPRLPRTSVLRATPGHSQPQLRAWPTCHPASPLFIFKNRLPTMFAPTPPQIPLCALLPPTRTKSRPTSPTPAPFSRPALRNSRSSRPPRHVGAAPHLVMCSPVECPCRDLIVGVSASLIPFP